MVVDGVSIVSIVVDVIVTAAAASTELGATFNSRDNESSNVSAGGLIFLVLALLLVVVRVDSASFDIYRCVAVTKKRKFETEKIKVNMSTSSFLDSLGHNIVTTIDNVKTNIDNKVDALRSSSNRAANDGTTLRDRVQQGLQTASTKIDQGLNTVGSAIVQPIQDTVQKVQTTVIVAIVLVIVLIFGVGVGMFFAGRASACSNKHATAGVGAGASANAASQFMPPITTMY
jgi:hypothetical protein